MLVKQTTFPPDEIGLPSLFNRFLDDVRVSLTCVNGIYSEQIMTLEGTDGMAGTPENMQFPNKAKFLEFIKRFN